MKFLILDQEIKNKGPCEVMQKIIKKEVDYSFNAPLYQKKRDGDKGFL